MFLLKKIFKIINIPHNLYLRTNFFYKNLFLYIRKNTFFNKGRYSRNRQTYRTGVYLCLYINIIIVIGLYFYFYSFLFKFTYIIYMFIFSIIIFALTLFFKKRLINFDLLKFRLNFYKEIFKNLYINWTFILNEIIYLFVKLKKKNFFSFYFISEILSRFKNSIRKEALFSDKNFLNFDKDNFENKIYFYKDHFQNKHNKMFLKSSRYNWLVRMNINTVEINEVTKEYEKIYK